MKLVRIKLQVKQSINLEFIIYRKALRNGIDLRQYWYLSMRRPSNLSPFGNLSHGVFFRVDLYFGRRRFMNIMGAVAGNSRLHHLKTAMFQTVFNTQSCHVCFACYHFQARAMFALRSRAVKKPYRASLIIDQNQVTSRAFGFIYAISCLRITCSRHVIRKMHKLRQLIRMWVYFLD